MPIPLQSPYANVLPFIETIKPKYWKQGIVPGGAILVTGSPSVESEYLFMMTHSPNPGTVSYTGDSLYPQFSEAAMGAQYTGQCAAFAKVVSEKRSLPTDKWLRGQSLQDFSMTMESHLPSDFQGLVIACFDGRANYALADASKKHVAILHDIIRYQNGNPKAIVVVDQNYYSYPPYTQYKGKIAKHTIPWGTATQKWVGYARSYHIVNM